MWLPCRSITIHRVTAMTLLAVKLPRRRYHFVSGAAKSATTPSSAHVARQIAASHARRALSDCPVLTTALASRMNALRTARTVSCSCAVSSAATSSTHGATSAPSWTAYSLPMLPCWSRGSTAVSSSCHRGRCWSGTENTTRSDDPRDCICLT